MTELPDRINAAIDTNPIPDPDRMHALVGFLNSDDAPGGEGRYVAEGVLALLAVAYGVFQPTTEVTP